MSYPGTMPTRQPFDITQLPPEHQAQLAAGYPVTFEDGSVVYPDGTFTGAGDSPNDFAVPDSTTMGGDQGGGMAAPATAPATAPPDMGTGGGGQNPFGGPVFDPYNQVAGGAFPGTPGGIGGGPTPDAFGVMGTGQSAPAVRPDLYVQGGASIVGGLPHTADPGMGGTLTPSWMQNQPGGWGQGMGQQPSSGTMYPQLGGMNRLSQRVNSLTSMRSRGR